MNQFISNYNINLDLVEKSKTIDDKEQYTINKSLLNMKSNTVKEPIDIPLYKTNTIIKPTISNDNIVEISEAEKEEINKKLVSIFSFNLNF